MKYRTRGGLVPKTYIDAVIWCRTFVSNYSISSGRRAGFLFGVIDPVKNISPQLRGELGSLLKVKLREFYFATGRNESSNYLGMFGSHPLFIPRLSLNNPSSECDHPAISYHGLTPEAEQSKLSSEDLHKAISSNEIVESAELLTGDKI
jgi:hypothetical protein